MLNNNHLLPIIIILIIGICFVSSSNDNKSKNSKNNNKMSDNNLIICLLVVGIVIFFIIQDNKKEGYLGYAPINNQSCYRQRPLPKINTPLVRDVTVHSPIGSPHPLTQDLASANFPTVDGDKKSPRHLFMLARNQASPECCPSTYSTSTGCICTNEKQNKFIQSRGSNQSGRVYPMDEVSGPYVEKVAKVSGMEERAQQHESWLENKKSYA